MAHSEKTRPSRNDAAGLGQRAVSLHPRPALRQDQLTPSDQAEFALCKQTIYADFQQITRSRSFPDFVPGLALLEGTALDLLQPLLPVRLGIRLLGVTLSSLNTEPSSASQQMTLAL